MVDALPHPIGAHDPPVQDKPKPDNGNDRAIIREELTASQPPSPDFMQCHKDSLIQSLTEELLKSKEDVARLTKERAYFKRKAEWCTIEDQRILSPIITTTDHWQEKTWLLLHEPIRGALLDFDELVKSPSFDPVIYPWKVTNFFYYFNTAFAPYVRRHHQAEKKVYVPWVASRVEVPTAVRDGYKAIEESIQKVEQSESEYKALEKAIRKGKLPPLTAADLGTSTVIAASSTTTTKPTTTMTTEGVPSAVNPSLTPSAAASLESKPASTTTTTTTTTITSTTSSVINVTADAPSSSTTTDVVPVSAPSTSAHLSSVSALPQLPQLSSSFQLQQAEPPQKQGPLYEWRSILITRLTLLSNLLTAHMDEEEAFFPPVICRHFSEKEEEKVLEQMSSASAAHLEIPMVLLAMDVWGTPEIREDFLKKLSRAARYTVEKYWLSSYKKSVAKSLESLALEEPPSFTIIPHMSVNQLLVAAPVFLLCTIS